MRLPKVLALAVTLILMGGGAATLTLRPAGDARASSLRLADSARSAGGSPAVRPATRGAARPGSTTVRLSPRDAEARLTRPASDVPISSGPDPANPVAPAGGKTIALPVPTSGSLPPVAPLQSVRSADAVVLAGSPITAGQFDKLSHSPGVAAADVVDTGTVTMGGAPVVAFGVEPGVFRAFTPAASASSNQLWQYLAGGSLVSSYDMATDRGLKLGSDQVVVPAGGNGAVTGWMGAFASIGLPGVDLLVDRAYSGDLGLTPSSGAVVSAPNLSGPQLQAEMQAAVPGSAVELLHPDQVLESLSGGSLDPSTRQKIVQAALSRVGMPYVWGGAGPSSFDCSGLVQWSYRQAGIAMPRVAAEQFLTGEHIPMSAALPGDLLFWGYDPSDPGYIDHTAIYLGNGMMVVAPHTGLDVQVVPVPTQDFAGAVSVVLRSS